MKIVLLVWLIFLLPVLTQGAGPSADDHWQRIERLKKPRPEGFTHPQYLKWNEQRLRELQQASLDFYAAYPADVRRWHIAVELIGREAPTFVREYLPDYDEKPYPGNTVIDEAAREAWKVRRAALLQDMITATGVPPGIREEAVVMAASDRLAAANLPDDALLVSLIEALVAQYPESRSVYYFSKNRINERGWKDQAVADLLWQKMENSRHAEIRQMAAGKRNVREGKMTPLQLKFTALDGREVDLAKLRGKVVLIDFWAIWCGPCVAELPRLRKLHADYHERGLEIIGISLDGPEDQTKLKAYVGENRLPWPQHFDGKAWKSKPVLDYAVESIPAVLLLDQEGRIVSNTLHGAELEPAIRQMLGL